MVSKNKLLLEITILKWFEKQNSMEFFIKKIKNIEHWYYYYIYRVIYFLKTKLIMSKFFNRFVS